jgi:hypothetical protein
VGFVGNLRRKLRGEISPISVGRHTYGHQEAVISSFVRRLAEGFVGGTTPIMVYIEPGFANEFRAGNCKPILEDACCW